MRSSTPVSCVTCQDAKIVMTTDGEEGRGHVIDQYANGHGGLGSLMIACPSCQGGEARSAVNYLDQIDIVKAQHGGMDYARDFALNNKPSGWLVLTGGYGTGKSTIAAAVADTLASRGVPVRRYTASALKDAMYEKFRSGDYAGWFLSLKRARALLIDEMDTVNWSNEAIHDMLFELINSRYESRAHNLTILIAADDQYMHIPPNIRSRMEQAGKQSLGSFDLRPLYPDEAPHAWDRGEGESDY